MTVQEINKSRNNGIFAVSNEAAGWYAISRDGSHMITFYEGHHNCSQKGDAYRIYKNEKSFAKRITQLLNRGY